METAQVNIISSDAKLILTHAEAMFKLLGKISLFSQRLNFNWVRGFAQDWQLPPSILRFRFV